jgi:hypothetical protein
VTHGIRSFVDGVLGSPPGVTCVDDHATDMASLGDWMSEGAISVGGT